LWEKIKHHKYADDHVSYSERQDNLQKRTKINQTSNKDIGGKYENVAGHLA